MNLSFIGIGTFDLLVFKVILGSFGALVSKWHVTGKHGTAVLIPGSLSDIAE